MKIIHALCAATVFLASQSYARTTISVNTTSDENGENTANCSLREAIIAVNTQIPFGGCPTGDRFGTTVIALTNAAYFLTKGEIVISHAMTIQGANTDDKELADRITGKKPNRMPAITTIDGNSQRIFNTTGSNISLVLSNLILTHGKADFGGAILAGGNINLSNTIITDNQATISGGAIYLSGRNASLSSSDTTLSKNTANKGAALGMSCIDQKNTISRNISLTNSSIITNGSIDNTSVIYACGNTFLTISNSTIAKNTAKSDGGILYFADATGKGSLLSIQSSTIVENKIAPVLSYGKLDSLSLTSSVLAFNDAGCAIKDGSTALSTNGKIIGGYNTLQNCPLAYTEVASVRIPDINLNDADHADANFATELHPLANYGGYTQTYLPRTTSKYILNRASLSTDTTCVRTDQRNSVTPIGALNKCDAGSVERRTATAVFDAGKTLNNNDDTNRIAEIVFLYNDEPSENESSRGDFGKDPLTGKYLIDLTDDANKQCTLVHSETAGETPIIRFDNKGVPFTEVDQPVLCKYRFTDNNGNLSNEGELHFKTINKAPIASDDSFILTSGTTNIQLDLLSNDNDKNDGIYGGLCTDTNNVLCNGLYIRLVSEPTLGVIEAERSGNCPDNSDLNKYRCYGGKITYRVKNAGSPFDDKFTYVVYDIDKAASNEATVTIINQAGAAEASNSGSLGWLSLFTLGALAAYRRMRKSYVA